MLLGARLTATFASQLDDETELEVGRIGPGPPWKPGALKGTQPSDGEATYNVRGQGMPWEGGEGPRGASEKICGLTIPPGMNVMFTATFCEDKLLDTLELWRANQSDRHGLVLYAYAPVPKIIIFTSETGIQSQKLKLEVDYCAD